MSRSIVDDLRNSQERALDGIARIIGRAPSVHRIDCCDADAMRKMFAAEGPIHGAIHFAADKAVGESVAHPLKYYQNNIGSLALLLQLMKEHGHRAHRVLFELHRLWPTGEVARDGIRA